MGHAVWHTIRKSGLGIWLLLLWLRYNIPIQYKRKTHEISYVCHIIIILYAYIRYISHTYTGYEFTTSVLFFLILLRLLLYFYLHQTFAFSVCVFDGVTWLVWNVPSYRIVVGLQDGTRFVPYVRGLYRTFEVYT